jgi:hypothetical protein
MDRWVKAAVSFIAAVIVSWIPMAVAEPLVFYAPHAGPPVTIDSENLGAFAKLAGPPHAVATGTKRTKAGNVSFNLIFADVTSDNNVGFDDPVLGATRRATALTVANYLNDVLDSPTVATLDIEFTVSQTDGTGFLASAGTFWFTSPNQYNSGFAWTHIVTGVDPFAGTADIRCTVDFGYNWNSDFDDPTGSEYDLATVLLHELTHGLGFVALADANGNSSISGGSPGVFSGVTDHLFRQTGSLDLWNSSYAFTGSSADLRSNDVYFTGTHATAANGGANPRMYAPGTFASGSSLSHWNTTTYPNSVMKHAIAPGTTSRQYEPFEIGLLKDIGYPNAVDLGFPVPVEISSFSTD